MIVYAGGVQHLPDVILFVGHYPFINKLKSLDRSMNPEEREHKLAILKQHLLAFSVPNDSKAWLALFVSLLIEVVAVLLIWQGFAVLGWTLHSLNAVRLFIQFHDMAHFSFFSSIALNRAVGRVIGVYVHFPFQAWRDGHNHHHKHFGNLDRMDLSQTIIFTKKQYDSMGFTRKILVRLLRQPVIFFLFTAPFVWFIGLIFTTAKRYGIFSWAYFDKILSLVVYLGIAPLLGIPWMEFAFTIYLALMMGTILFHLQHSVNLPYRQHKEKWDFTRAALEGSTFLYIPWLLRPFTNGIEYHHIHHLNTNVASYVIAECHDMIEAGTLKGVEKEDLEKEIKENAKGKELICWDYFGINRVGIANALKSMANVMLDEETNLLLPFSYKHL